MPLDRREITSSITFVFSYCLVNVPLSPFVIKPLFLSPRVEEVTIRVRTSRIVLIERNSICFVVSEWLFDIPKCVIGNCLEDFISFWLGKTSGI